MTEPFSIGIKISNFEVQLSGSKADVMDTLEKLPVILKSLAEAIGSTPTLQEIKSVGEYVEEPKQAPSVTDELPTINVAGNTKCPEVIIKLLSTEWGRTTPRTFKEIMEAMKVNALYFPEGTVLGRLTDLTKKGIVRRMKTERGFAYILLTDQ